MGTALGIMAATNVSAQPTDPIMVDFDGTGNNANGNGTVEIGSLDWAVGASLADQVLVTDPFMVYTHAALQGAADINGDPVGVNGLNSAFEWTFILGVNETATSFSQSTGALLDDGGDGVGGGNDVYAITQSANFEDAASQTNFFMNIYYDDNIGGGGTKANSLTGEGYDDGTLILSATTPINMSGNFTSTVGSFVDVDNDGEFTQGTDTLITDPNDPNWVFALFDQNANGDDWSSANFTYYSVTGEGATQLDAEVGSQNTDFFVTLIGSIFSDLHWTTQNVDPFLETNPSKCFDSDGATSADTNASSLCLADGDIVFGEGVGGTSEINGITGLTADQSGQDIMFQTDANQAFRTTQAVPEPGILALLGFGLGILSMSQRRRCNRV